MSGRADLIRGDGPAILVTARDEAGRLGVTLDALAAAFPGAPVVVADDGSRDATAAVARARGAHVVVARRRGKGEAATLGARELPSAPVVLLCDADLGASAQELPALVRAVEEGRGDLAVATFARRVGGGVGLVLRASGRAVERAAGVRPRAPLSGQRALRRELLDAVLPFAPGFGMETGMTLDALRAGYRLVEVELALEHRATGRTPAGFLHRARQLRDVLRASARARRPPGRGWTA
jgi:glycosyltransferase involved in cell wall biosynthesis